VDFSQRLRAALRKTPLRKIKHALDERFKRPNITDEWFPPAKPDLNRTLLICVEAGYDQSVKNAAYFMPLGFAQGWNEVAGGAKIIFAKHLLREIEHHPSAAVFISQLSLRHFSDKEARSLRGKDLFVWVHVHPRSFSRFECDNPLVPKEESETFLVAYSKVVLAEPKFVWNAIGKSGMEWYEGWREDGFHWESIFPGANASLYYPEPTDRFKNVKMAYVGGYWEEKAQAFTSYLRPWEELLVPYGYNRWPYKNYAGGLDETEERQLYSSAGLIPLVTGPAGWRMAEITERYLKAPACKAFCIADENPALREVFREEEMLQAQSAEHFHQLVNDWLQGRIDVERWRNAAYKAVQDRHLVKHRALQILRALDRQ
jgi:hypothetical protein